MKPSQLGQSGIAFRLKSAQVLKLALVQPGSVRCMGPSPCAKTVEITLVLVSRPHGLLSQGGELRLCSLVRVFDLGTLSRKLVQFGVVQRELSSLLGCLLPRFSKFAALFGGGLSRFDQLLGLLCRPMAQLSEFAFLLLDRRS